MFPSLYAYVVKTKTDREEIRLAVGSADTAHFMTILIMALALGMDAFSLGIGIGMKGIRLPDVLKISLTVGLFHILMPLCGMLTGHYVSRMLGDIAILAGGGLLMLLGLHMIYSSIRGEESASFDYRSIFGVMVFALSVSIDSFSAGISLGLFASDLLLTILLFGALGTVMNTLGLLVGRKASFLLGGYGEALGGVILLAFGVKFIL